jgi:hypothetical protein
MKRVLLHLEFLFGVRSQPARAPIVCLYYGDYGPGDPAFDSNSGSPFSGRGWSVDASLLKDARNSGEAEAIQRHLLRGGQGSWCDQEYAWAEQDAVAWFYIAAFLFVVLPYLIMKIRALKKGALRLAVR